MGHKADLSGETTDIAHKSSDCFVQGEKVSIVGIVGNILLTSAKMTAGIGGHSMAMVADVATLSF